AAAITIVMTRSTDFTRGLLPRDREYTPTRPVHGCSSLLIGGERDVNRRRPQRVDEAARRERDEEPSPSAVHVHAIEIQDRPLDVDRQHLARAERRRAAH